MAGVYEKVQKLADAASLQTAAYNNCTMHLFSNNFNPVGNETLSSFTETAFSGYANVTIATWGAAFYDANGDAKTTSTAVEFTHNGGNTTDVAYGYYLVHGNSTILGAQRFDDAPIGFNGLGNSCVVVSEITIGPTLDSVEIHS